MSQISIEYPVRSRNRHCKHYLWLTIVREGTKITRREDIICEVPKQASNSRCPRSRQEENVTTDEEEARAVWSDSRSRSSPIESARVKNSYGISYMSIKTEHDAQQAPVEIYNSKHRTWTESPMTLTPGEECKDISKTEQWEHSYLREYNVGTKGSQNTGPIYKTSKNDDVDYLKTSRKDYYANQEMAKCTENALRT